MACRVSDDVACFDSLPDDLVGVIMGKLDFPSAVRLTQACPTARRLVQGERAVPGVLGTVSVVLPVDYENHELRVEVQDSGFWFGDIEYLPNGKEYAKRQPGACIVHLLEWIRVRASAFTEIVVETCTYREIVRHLANTFLPNVPSSYRGKISFRFTSNETELKHLSGFLAKWRALSPAYECGLALECRHMSSDRIFTSLEAAPPLSSLATVVDDFPGFKFLESLDTSRLTMLDTRSWALEDLPSKDVLPPTIRDLTLGLHDLHWDSLDAFLTPLHRLTALKLDFDDEDWQLDQPLTLTPFTVLPNLRVLAIDAFSFAPPPLESDYWRESIVLPALEELSLQHYDGRAVPRGRGGPVAGPPRWPILLSNLQAPKLERLKYEHVESRRRSDCYRMLDLPLGRFTRLRYFYISTSTRWLVVLPALRAEIATLRHLERPRSGDVSGQQRSTICLYQYHPKDRGTVPDEEVKAWKLELGFSMEFERHGRYLKSPTAEYPLMVGAFWIRQDPL